MRGIKGRRYPQVLQRWLLWACLGLVLAVGAPAMVTQAQQVPSPLRPEWASSLTRDQEAQRLTLEGQRHLEQGQAQAALECWLQAEARYRELGYTTGVLGSQLNQAKALQALGFYRRARTMLEAVVAAQQQQSPSLLQVNSLLTLGHTLRLVGDYELAQQVLTTSLQLAQQLNSRSDIQAAHFHLGNTYLAQQEIVLALKNFQQAAAIAAELQRPAQLRQLKLLYQLNRLPEAEAVLAQVSSQLATVPPTQQSIYGQIELATLLPTARSLQAAQLLANAAQQAKALGHQQAESYALGRLGHLYENAQQTAIAVQLTRDALQLARALDVPEMIYQWQWQMGRLLRSQHDWAGATTAYSEAVEILQSLRNDLVAIGQDVQFSFRDQVEPVYRELVDLLLQPAPSPVDGAERAPLSQTNLRKARQVLESLQLAELNDFFQEACLDANAQSIDTIDPTAAVIYPVILPDRLAVILSVPGQTLQHYATFQPKTATEAGIAQMQAALRRTSFAQERLVAAQQLYRWLVQPAAAALAQQNIQTLVFVLDGSLRTIPMAALHDGQHYLIEQYQVALAPSLQLLSSSGLQRDHVQALVGGLSEGVAGTTSLPGVQQEVDQIRRHVPAQILLNQSFTTAALRSQLQTKPFSVVHLATHGQFSSNAKETYVQTWDGRLTINDLQALLQQQSAVDAAVIDLLVLSACETAEGDSRAVLGMAGVAVRSGARSTLATLWMVNDASTATFVTEFYKTLMQPKVTKAQAVRAAQLSLLQSLEFRHPFYWAPFVLVGNWF